MRGSGAIAYFLMVGMSAPPALAGEFQITEVDAIAHVREPAPYSIAFSDHRDGGAAGTVNGFIPFEEWAKNMPLQKHFLSLYPSYVERTVESTVGGPASPEKERLHVYVASARFGISRPPEAIDLSRYASVSFLERIDPAIKHRVISAAEADRSLNKNPNRQWCRPAKGRICIESRYELEGKLPMGVQLVNKLSGRKKKIADYLSFQSELDIVPPSEIDQAGLTKLVGIDVPVTGVLEQNIFYVNQIMEFGKFLAVLQPDQVNPGRTIATTFMALAVKSRLIEDKKKYENTPVLRNLVPALVLAGKSSFNTGRSISAGLPFYARNNVKAVAGILEEK